MEIRLLRLPVGLSNENTFSWKFEDLATPIFATQTVSKREGVHPNFVSKKMVRKSKHFLHAARAKKANKKNALRALR